MPKINVLTILWIGLVLTFTACTEDALPKPYGYPRLEYKKSSYKTFDSDCPFTFEYNTQALKNKKDRYCAYDIYLPSLKATLYLQYLNIKNNLPELIKDAEKSVYDPHSVKADYIKPQIIIRSEDRVYGTLYELGGEAALNYQFHLTDSTQHFLRGSVYFNAHPQPDSLAPALEYVKKDVVYLMESLEWK